MELHILPILTFFSIALVVSQAALPPEMYWKKMLPNTDMPNAIKNSLPKPEWMEDKGTSVTVGKGGVHVNTGGAKQGRGGTTVDVGPHKGVGVSTQKPNGGHTYVNVGPKSGVGVNTGKPGGGHTDVNIGPKNGVGINTGKFSEDHTDVNVGPKGGVGVNTGKPDGGHTDVNVGPKSGVRVNTGKPDGGHTDVNVGPKNGVGVNTGKPNGGHTDVNVGPKSGVGVHTGKPSGGHTDVNVGPKHGVGVNTGKPGQGGTHVGVGKGGVTVHGDPHKKPVYVGVKPGKDPFKYNYAASEAQLHDDPTRALFFLEKDMKAGHSMKLHFTKSTNEATFLPREEADSLPFSSEKIPAILREFSVEPKSEEADTIKETIKGCERKGIQGEQKYCATSLESMVEYAKKSLGKNVKAMSTEFKGPGNNVGTYTITSVKKVSDDNEVAICHKQKYAYAVFYCHKSKGTSAYMVSLMGGKGSKSNAMAVCHKDTKAWNPKHLAFQVLNVKPGSVPVCHFLPEDHIVWAPY